MQNLTNQLLYKLKIKYQAQITQATTSRPSAKAKKKTLKSKK